MFFYDGVLNLEGNQKPTLLPPRTAFISNVRYMLSSELWQTLCLFARNDLIYCSIHMCVLLAVVTHGKATSQGRMMKPAQKKAA